MRRTPTPDCRLCRRTHARKLKMRSRDRWCGMRDGADHQCGDPPRQYRPCCGRTSHWADWPRRSAPVAVEIAHAQYSMGGHCAIARSLMPTRAQVHQAMQEVERDLAHALCRSPGDRPGSAGLLRPAAEGVHGRMGASLVERDAVRTRVAVPCRRDHPRPRILVGARPSIARHLAEIARVPGVPRHRLDGRALPILRAARDR